MQKSASKFFPLFALVCFGFAGQSQNSLADDIQLVKNIRVETKAQTPSIRPFIYSKEESPVVKYNPVNLAFGGLLFLYQNTLSQQFSAACLYNPSCSEFSKQSISEYGLLKGLFLSADRAMRCNRIAATGIHPLRIENNKVADPVGFYHLK